MPQAHTDPPPRPSCDLSVEEVLATVLRALAGAEGPDADSGVAVTYAFASERMRFSIGDQAAFRRAFRNTLYRPLLGHLTARVERFERRGDAARASVTVAAVPGGSARFTIALARAGHGERRGCWLLSGLAREGVDL